MCSFFTIVIVTISHLHIACFVMSKSLYIFAASPCDEARVKLRTVKIKSDILLSLNLHSWEIVLMCVCDRDIWSRRLSLQRRVSYSVWCCSFLLWQTTLVGCQNSSLSPTHHFNSCWTRVGQFSSWFLFSICFGLTCSLLTISVLS